MITIIMTTYVPSEEGGHVRGEYAAVAARALRQNLVSREPLNLHVADDGSERVDWVAGILDSWPNATMTSVPRRGIGGSLNEALKHVRPSDKWFYTTDDWVLTAPLSLDRAATLIEHYGYAYVRLAPIHPNLRCRTRFEQPIGWWLDIDPAEGYAFATRPFLASTRFYNHYGPFVEGVDAYVTERDYSDRVNAGQRGNLKLAMDAQYGLEGPWEHIGEYEVGRIIPTAVKSQVLA